MSVKKRSYTEQQCYLKALSIDGECAEAWVNLSTTMSAESTVNVGGRSYSKKQCTLRALDINDSYKLAWTNLGCALSRIETEIVKGRPFTKLDCQLKALAIDNGFARAWANLGNAIAESKVKVGDKEYTALASCIMALELDKTLAFAWGNLGVKSWTSSIHPIVNGKTYTHTDCFRQSCLADPEDGFSFCWFAHFVAENAEVTLKGQTFTRLQLYERACSVKKPLPRGRFYSLIRQPNLNEKILESYLPKTEASPEIFRGLALFYCGIGLDPAAEVPASRIRRTDYFLQMQLPCDMLEYDLPFWDEGKRADLLAAVVTYRFDELPTPSTLQTAPCFKCPGRCSWSQLFIRVVPIH